MGISGGPRLSAGPTVLICLRGVAKPRRASQSRGAVSHLPCELFARNVLCSFSA